MSLVEIVGFDNCATVADLELLQGWNVLANSSALDLTAGRIAGNSVRFNYSASTGQFQKVLPTPQNVVMCGFAIRGQWGTNSCFVIFEDVGGTSGNYDHISLTGTDAGVFSVRAGDSIGTVIGTFTIPSYNAAQFYYFEIGMLISTTAGTVQVWVDGTSMVSLTGQKTNNSDPGNNTVYAVDFIVNGSSGPAYPIQIDDFYVGSAISDQCGPVRVQTLAPAAASGTPQWTPLSGSNLSNVNQSTAQDGDTTYNSSATPGQTDLYTVSALASTTTTIYAVQPRVTARRDDTGVRTIATVVKSGTTTVTGTAFGLNTGYTSVPGQLLALNPNGSVAWTATSANAAIVGYTEVS